MVRPERLELPTLCSEGRCSIRLSYGRVKVFYGNVGVDARCPAATEPRRFEATAKELLLWREVAFAGADLQVFL